VEYVLAGLIGYLLGSVPVAVLVARRHGVDLHAVGDGNPGAWNALEHLGPWRAWPVFAGDALKGCLAGLAGLALPGGWWVGWAGVAGAMLGHALPAFDRLRGGKSVMAFVGGMVALAPAAAGIALVCCVVVTLLASFPWCARVCVFLIPVAQLPLGPVEHVIGTGVLMTAIGVLFAARRRTPAPATTGPDAAPRA
jgi:acyl phosphate:glycerol-3-phosphate acyltransferase